MYNNLCNLIIKIEHITGSKLLTFAETALYLKIDIKEVELLVNNSQLKTISPNIHKIKAIDIAKFELGIKNEFIYTDNFAVDTNAYQALQSIQNLNDTVNEEDFNMAITTYGEGSVYWNNNRNKFQCAFFVIDKSGIKKRKIVSGNSKIEAIGKMQTVKKSVNNQSISVPYTDFNIQTQNNNILTFGSVATEYMNFWEKKGYTDRAKVDKELAMNSFVMPYFKNKTISDIKPLDIQSFLSEIQYSKNGELKSNHYIKKIYNAFKAVMNYALEENYITRIPTKGIKLPQGKETNKNDKYFEKDQLITILRAVLNNEKYLMLCVVLLGTGIRTEEFLALQWQDIDFNKKTISINKAMIRCLSHDGKNKWTYIIGKTKTASSNRIIPIGDTVLNQLKQWKCYLNETGILKKAKKQSLDSFIVLDKEGKIQKHYSLLANFKGYLQRRGLKNYNVTFHKFRHCYATHLRALGIDPMLIKVFMGHTLQGDITESTYTSVTENMNNDASIIIDSFMNGVLTSANNLGTLKKPNVRNGKNKAYKKTTSK